jgi:hypothetical protein
MLKTGQPGFTDGKTVSLTLRSTNPFSPTTAGTAALDGDKLTLSIAGRPRIVDFHRSDLTEFEKPAAALRNRSAKLLAQEAAAAALVRQQRALAEIDQRQSQAAAAQQADQRAASSTLAATAGRLGTAIDAFSARLDRAQLTAARAEQQFRANSSKLAISRRLAAAGSADQRYRYENATATLQSQSDQLRNWIEQGVESLTRDEDSLTADIGTVQVACAATTNAATAEQLKAQKFCADLKPRVSTFATKRVQASTALNRALRAYSVNSTSAG